jgi:hypothetical protein
MFLAQCQDPNLTPRGTELRTQKGELCGHRARDMNLSLCLFITHSFLATEAQQADRPRSSLDMASTSTQPFKKPTANRQPYKPARRAAARCRAGSSIATTDWSEGDANPNGLPSLPGESRRKKSPCAAALTPIPSWTPGLSSPGNAKTQLLTLCIGRVAAAWCRTKKQTVLLVDRAGMLLCRAGHRWWLRLPPSSWCSSG